VNICRSLELHHEDSMAAVTLTGERRGDSATGPHRHVADVYDAITSDRAYRKAMTERKCRK